MPNICPHCRRPVRARAKFCGFCAANLIPPSPTIAAPVPSPNLLPMTPSLDLTSEVRQRRAKRKRSRMVVSLVFLVIVCLAIALPSIFLIRPLVKELFSPATATRTATSTAISVPTNTPTLLPSATRVPSETPTRMPSLTPTMLPSPTRTRLLPPTNTSTPAPVVLFDDFGQPLDLLWQSWGSPSPTTVISGTNQALLLTAVNVGSAGISSLNNLIPLTPGVVIAFTADVDYLDDDTAVLRFSWLPGESIPLEQSAPAPLSLLIEPKQLTVQIIKADGTPTSCSWQIEDTTHAFEINLDGEWLPIIFVDDSMVCENLLAPIAQPNLLEGRIHFSGGGLIDDVSVSITP